MTARQRQAALARIDRELAKSRAAADKAHELALTFRRYGPEGDLARTTARAADDAAAAIREVGSIRQRIDWQEGS